MNTSPHRWWCVFARRSFLYYILFDDSTVKFSAESNLCFVCMWNANILLADRQWQVREIAEILDILKDRVGSVGFSLQTTVATVRLHPSSVWLCLSSIRRSFYFVSTKHELINSHHRPINSQNSGLHSHPALKKAKTFL